MFKFDDEDEKEAKGSALRDIIDEMDNRQGDKFKKPVMAEMSVTKVAPEDGADEELGEESGDMSADELTEEELSEDPASPDQGMSEHDKAMIAALYERFCK